MFATLIREGETVRLPSGRLGIIEGYFEGVAHGRYLDDGEEWQLNPKFLTFVASTLAGALIGSEP